MTGTGLESRDPESKPLGKSRTASPLGESRALPELHDIDEYRLLELVGEGGMGEVYKAEQRGALRRIVALKVIRLGLDTKTVIARFDAERQALALMNHPNIARVFDGGSTTLGRPYFVMEYVPGKPITSYCDERKLPIRQRLELFSMVCDAIQHAHSKGIIHRDLKASNVLVAEIDGKPIPKVIDFGVAKAINQRLTEKTLFTETGRLVGTPAYASPEQAAGGADVDTRSDVYSLGVLLYELLTGALPFDPTKLREMAYGEMQRIIREVDPPRPSTFYSTPSEASRSAALRRAATVEELASTLRHELEWIPLRAMRKERSERYQTASEFGHDIQSYLAGRPLMAAPDSRIYRWRKAIRRNRGLAAAVGAVVLALLLGLVMTSWQAYRAQRQKNLAEANAAEARKHLSQADALASLLNDLFEGIQPNVVKGRNTELLVAVLRAAEPKIDKMLSEPGSRAEHLVILGKALQILGETDKARELLDRARSLAEQSFEAALASGQFDPGKKQARTFVDALEKLGELHLNLGDNVRAESLLRQGLAIGEAHLPSNDPIVTHQMANVGVALLQQGKLQEAADLFEKAMARAEAAPASHPPSDRASIAFYRGAVSHSMKDNAGAAAAFDSAETLFQEAGLTHTTHYATLLSYKAALSQEQQRYDEALAHVSSAIELRQRLGPDLEPLSLAIDLERRSQLLAEMGRTEDAANDRIEALRLQRLALPNPNIPKLLEQAQGAEYLGANLQEARQPEAAVAALAQAISMYTELLAKAERERASSASQPSQSTRDWDAELSGYHKRLLASQQRWAQITFELGGARQALPVIRECLARQTTLYAGDQSPDAFAMLATTQWILAEVMLALEPQNVQEPLALLLEANQKLIEGNASTKPTPAGRPSVRERVLRRVVAVYEMLDDQHNAERFSRELTGLNLGRAYHHHQAAEGAGLAALAGE